METDRLIILGLSEPTLTMIFDNLESCGRFPRIHIVNNLGLDDLKPFRNPLFGVDVVGRYEDVGDAADAFLGVNKPHSKRAVFELFEARRLTFTAIVHRSAAVSSTARLGQGVNVNSLVSIAAYATIGRFVSINRNASVGHHSEVGDFVTINPGAHIAGFVRVGAYTHRDGGECGGRARDWREHGHRGGFCGDEGHSRRCRGVRKSLQGRQSQ